MEAVNSGRGRNAAVEKSPSRRECRRRSGKKVRVIYNDLIRRFHYFNVLHIPKWSLGRCGRDVENLTQCCFNVGPLSLTSAQH